MKGVLLLLVALAAIVIGLLMKRRDGRSESPGFLLALPYQGSANQLTCLVRAAYLASLTNRTLLVPLLYPSNHDTIEDPKDWNRYIFLDRLLEKVKYMSAERFLESNYITSCHSYGKWSKIEHLGQPSVRFSNIHSIEYLYHHEDWPRPPLVHHLLESMKRERVYCIGNLQHVHFDNIDSEFQRIKFRHKGKNRIELAVHWRRGDFKKACLNKNMSSCYPPISRLGQLVDSQKFTNIRIFTNDIQELELHGLGKYAQKEQHIFEEMSLMVEAYLFIGNRYSTISRIVRTLRQSKNLSTTFF